MSSLIEAELLIKDNPNSADYIYSKSQTVITETTTPDAHALASEIVDNGTDADKHPQSGDTLRNNNEVSESVDLDKQEDLQLFNNITSTYFKRNMIIYYIREFVCVCALILTSYATFQNLPPKTSNISSPKPFFPKGSLVYDWPSGQLGVSQNRVAASELSFVLFYAPWCAESQYARTSYEYVARLFYREAHFAAINCWQPGGECRQQYSKVMSWPVLMAYLQNGIAIPYNGKWTNKNLSRFVLSLLNPITRINNPDDLLKLVIVHDVVVIAFVDIKHDKTQYNSFYRAAIKWIERDPFQEVAFAVVTGQSAKNFGFDVSPSVRMYLWNETLEYPNDTWNQFNLSNWIVDNIHQVSIWLSPPGTKSNSLGPYLKQGPVLFLFTPRHLYAEFSDAYLMIHQIGLEYFNCPNDEWIKELSRKFITEERQDNHQKHLLLLQECKNLLNPNQIQTNIKRIQKPRTVSVSIVNNMNFSKLPDEQHCQMGPQNIDYFFEQSSCFNEKCFTDVESSVAVPTKSIIHNQVIGVQGNIFKTSMLQVEYDNRSPENLRKITQKKKCEMLFLSKRKHHLFLDDNQNEPNFDIISGLSCKFNKTLSLMAIDSMMYHTFAERLGIDVLNYSHQSAAIIMDHENESTFVLNEAITTNSLVNFINNFVSRKLGRYLRKGSTTKPKNAPNYFKYAILEKRYAKNKTIGIRELHSDTFAENVMITDKTVVVLFYSVQCALCSLLTQNLLMASKILSNLPNLEFVRIDGDKNDLPWQYTMEKFPSLIIFPANRKSESRIYPISLKIDLPNILGFVLANLNRPNRLHGIVSVCKHMKKLPPFEDCLSVLRNEITNNISYSLHQWRNVPHQRGQILRRLQSLQRFYLHLFRIDHSCDFNSLDLFVKHIVSVWTM